MGHFFHAVHVFANDLANVHWNFLALGLALHVARLFCRAIAWRAILVAAYPENPPRFRSALGAYLAGVGVNSIAPARAGDVVKIYLIKHRMPDASYATLAPTLVVETLFDFVVGIGLIAWALSIGVLPTHQVYSRLPSVDWGFLLKHEKWTAIGVAVIIFAAVAGLVLFLEKGEAFRARFARGFAILRDPSRFIVRVVLPQAVSWVLRGATVYYFLRAFDVHADVHNALLAMVVDSLATLFPATPGGAGTKQGLIVFLFAGQAVSKAALLAFSVGLNIAITVLSLILGAISLFTMARTLSWRKVRARAEEAT